MSSDHLGGISERRDGSLTQSTFCEAQCFITVVVTRCYLRLILVGDRVFREKGRCRKAETIKEP